MYIRGAVDAWTAIFQVVDGMLLEDRGIARLLPTSVLCPIVCATNKI